MWLRTEGCPSSRAPNGRKTKELPVRVLFRRHLFRREQRRPGDSGARFLLILYHKTSARMQGFRMH